MPGFGPPGYPLGKLVQQDGNMTRLAACAMGYLMAATGAIGHDNGGGILAHRGKQAQLRHLHRHIIMAGVIAETAGHAASGGLDQFRLGIRDQFQHLQDRRHRPECLLMTMAVQQDGRRRRLERQGETAGFRLTRQKFFQQQSL